MRTTKTTATVKVPVVDFGTGANISPEYDEMLRLAQERVQVATQPGAFGNGIPFLTDITSMLPWIGIAISAAIGALIAARILYQKCKARH